jgi:hypothetical protein
MPLRTINADFASSDVCGVVVIAFSSIMRIAFIVENGAPIELLEFTDPKHPARLSNRMDG